MVGNDASVTLCQSVRLMMRIVIQRRRLLVIVMK